MNREQEIASIELELGRSLPASYRQFLLEQGSGMAFGLPVLGLSGGEGMLSALDATTTLRLLHSGLDYLVVIRTLDERMLCIDLHGGDEQDAPLVELAMDTQDGPKRVHDSFRLYMLDAEKSQATVQMGLVQVKEILDKNYSYTRENADEKVRFKARDWRAIRQCIHDLITGLLTFRHSEPLNGMEVGVFLTTDHPDYEPGHGLQAALVLLFSEAHKNGSSLCLKFLEGAVPSTVVKLCDQAGIHLSRVDDGIVTHKESLSILQFLVGADAALVDALHEKALADDGNFSLQGICYLIACNVWSAEQIRWTLANAPNPFDTLFGRVAPEDAYSFERSIAYARALVSVDFLAIKLQNHRSIDGETKVEACGALMKITPYQDAVLDWGLNPEPIEIHRGEVIHILPRPRYLVPRLADALIEDARILASEAPDAPIRFILYPKEMTHQHDFTGRFHRIMKDMGHKNIGVLFLPYPMSEVDERVHSKFKKVRSIRK